MKALICDAWGPPRSLRLGELPDPSPAAGEVLLDTHACGINFADTLMVQGKYQEKPAFPFSPGLEVAGVVAAVGPEVSSVSTGERVIALCGHGGMAERVAAPASAVSAMPASMDFVTGAGFSIVYGTAHVALDHKARLQPGETLLVHGAAGGVGLAAVELGKIMGATVIATASDAGKRELALAHGADHALDYAQGGFRDAVKDLTGGCGADVVFDPVGGEVFDQSMRCIAFDGRLLVIGFASGQIPQLKTNHALVKSVSVMGLYWGAYRERKPEVLTSSWRTLMAWFAEGRLRPHVGSTLPLAQAVDGLEQVMNREARGKVVIRIR